MMEFVENSDKALAALEKRDAAKEQSNEVKVTIMKILVMMLVLVMMVMMMVMKVSGIMIIVIQDDNE